MRTSLALAAVLTLGGVAAAPLVTSPASVTAASGAVFAEVTFADAIVQADRDLLDELGATGVTVTGARTYRAALPTGVVEALAAEARVADVRVLSAAERTDDALDRLAVTAVIVRVQADAVDALVADVARLGGQLLGTSDVPEVDGLVEVVALLDGTTAASLAASPAVAYVGPAPFTIAAEGERTNAVLARLTPPGSPNDALFGPTPSFEPRYEEWLAELGIDGSGVTVAVVDDGVDEEHPQLNVTHTKDYATPHDEPIDGTGHGTHVAGIIGATGMTVPDALATDADGFEPGVGVAPAVALTNQNLIATSALFTNHVALFEQTVRDALGFGANIWNASWTSGEGTGVGYLASGARLDALVRDGDADAPGIQPFTMAFSAGNSGSGESTLTAPKEAKNILVIAALESPTDPALAGIGDPREIASFSSRGPTKDGRIGITVAAPGANVRSTKSLGGGGLCFEPVTDPVAPLYSYCSGTSMASPHAAGAAALITQWWREGQGDGADPSPALIKALLVNSAVDVQFPDIPNIHEGWGRIDLESLFRPTAGRVIRDQQDVLTDPAETHVHTVTSDGTTPLKVTLDWLDPAGDPAAAAAIVNDLDLVVTAPNGTTYLGNAFDKGWSKVGGTPDRLELLENVYVRTPQAGTWTVEVRAHALPADGALFRGDTTDQDYTLVVSGTS